MKIFFTRQGWSEFCYWREKDNDIFVKIKELIKSIKEQPFIGLGKPEPLKHQHKGLWSRRINAEHRLVYKITGKKGVDQSCTIIQCRFHYDK